MANFCIVCGRNWPPEPVRVLIIGGDLIEFCDDCKDSRDVLVRADGTRVSLMEAWEEARAQAQEQGEA